MLTKDLEMGMGKFFLCCCTLLSVTCSVKKLPSTKWQITYRKVGYLFGSELLQIGTDSCYYESQVDIHKSPPIFKWKSGSKKLRSLYNQVMSFKLQQGSPIMASVTEMHLETLELVQEGKIVFSLQKHMQSQDYEKKFDEVVAILKSFAFSENGGWKY